MGSLCEGQPPGATPQAQGWPAVITAFGATETITTRLIRAFYATDASALAFCRLLDKWARGDPKPSTPGLRQAALRRAAERVETALAGLDEPLSRYLLELEPEAEDGRSWYGGPGPGEVLDWGAVLQRAGVSLCPNRVARAYLELAVLVRALEGLSYAVRISSSPDRDSLWAGLFDLRENLFGAADNLRALAA